MNNGKHRKSPATTKLLQQQGQCRKSVLAVLKSQFQAGDVVEVKVKHGGKYFYGFYDNLQKAADEAARSNTVDSTASYGINPRDPANCPVTNRLGTMSGAQHSQILKRKKLLIDIVHRRPPSSVARCKERIASRQLAEKIIDAMKTNFGWPGPDLISTGRGTQLIYRIDLPTNDNGLTKSVLQWIGNRFLTGNLVEIDIKTHYPNQLAPLPGTDFVGRGKSGLCRYRIRILRRGSPRCLTQADLGKLISASAPTPSPGQAGSFSVAAIRPLLLKAKR